MTVRHALLALLVEHPRYGSQLRTDFEARTGGTWPLNIGQVFTTLARLERDGLVEADGHDDAGRAQWRATEDGAAAVRAWWHQPVPRDAPARDELAIKLALAVTVPGVDVTRLVQTQRTATLRAMQDYTRLKEAGAPDHDLAWSLVLDSLVFAAEAEVRWLDHCEARIARAARLRRASTTTTTTTDTSPSRPTRRTTAKEAPSP